MQVGVCLKEVKYKTADVKKNQISKWMNSFPLSAPSDPQLQPAIIISDRYGEFISIAGPSDPHWVPQTLNYLVMP